MTSLVAADDNARESEDIVAQFSDSTEVALGHGMTDQRRRAWLGAIGQQRHCLYLELPRPELGQRRDIAGGSEPEPEVLPHHDSRRVQRPNHRVDKLRRAPTRGRMSE